MIDERARKAFDELMREPYQPRRVKTVHAILMDRDGKKAGEEIYLSGAVVVEYNGMIFRRKPDTFGKTVAKFDRLPIMEEKVEKGIRHARATFGTGAYRSTGERS